MLTSDALPTIKETTWKPGQRPELDRALARSPYESPSERQPFWTAYLPGSPPEIILCLCSRDRDEAFPRLAAYLRQVRPSSLHGYLFAVDTYYQSRQAGKPLPASSGTESGSEGGTGNGAENSPQLGELQPTGDPVVDEVLSPSQGLLLWQSQLESLAQALGLLRPDAIQLRRHVVQRRPDPLKLLEETEGAREVFPSGLSLVEVLEERLYYDAVVPGQWRAARLLIGASKEAVR